MEEFIFTIGYFPAKGAPSCGSRAYVLTECDAVQAFNETNNDRDAQNRSEADAHGERTVTMLIRVRDLQLIAHREWKPADPNQPELAL
jgi:hypothetical protein